MAITSTGLNAATNADYQPATATEDISILDKDDFLKLLLVELQYQDPTEPTDTEAILTQTSQLATLESAQNTNDALAELATALGSSQQFSSIAAIGKTADLGSNAISYDEGDTSAFEVYFPDDVANGTIEVLDVNGNIVQNIDLEENPSGVYQFEWDGSLTDGSTASTGVYYITSSYNTPEGDAKTTRMGSYPIESVKFEDGNTLVRVGSSYVTLDSIAEIY